MWHLYDLLDGSHGRDLANVGIAFVPLTKNSYLDVPFEELEQMVPWWEAAPSLRAKGARERLETFLQPPSLDRIVTRHELEEEQVPVVPMEIADAFDGSSFAVGGDERNTIPGDIISRDRVWRDNGRRFAPIRRVLAAATQDLLGLSARDVSARLGLTEHVPPHAHAVKPSPSGAYAYIREGRRILHAIEAWPWAHFDQGQLPREWWRDDLAIDPIAEWLWRRVTGRQRRLERFALWHSRLLEIAERRREERNAEPDDVQLSGGFEPEHTTPLQPGRLLGTPRGELADRLRELHNDDRRRNRKNARGRWGAEIAKNAADDAARRPRA